jgi:transcriptional regulator with XRE-family HTH domain
MKRDFEAVRRSLGEAVRHRRGLRQLSQERLALDADVDRTYVSQIERGIGNPSLLVLCKIAATLDVDVSELVIDHEP